MMKRKNQQTRYRWCWRVKTEITKMTKKFFAKLVFIPSPGMGHLVTGVEMAKLLLDRDDRLSITMIIIKLPSQVDVSAYVDSLAAEASTTDMSERIEFIDLAKLDGYDSSAESNPGFVKSLFIESQKTQVRNVVAGIFRSTSGRPDSPRLAGFVIDMFCTTMIDVANEFGAPTYMFYTCGAAFLGLMLLLQSRKDEHGLNATEFKNDPSTELAVPSFVQPVPASALPYLVVEKSCVPFLLEHARRMKEIKGVMVNSFLELESHAFSCLVDGVLPKVYPVGPVLSLNRDCISSRILSSGTRLILKWLDDQPNSSVVFLCFGSMGSLHEDQVKEMAYALEHSGLRFLWSLRRPPQRAKSLTYESPGDYENPREVLPDDFIDRTAERGRVIGWAPQVDILSHPSIGGFVSHCGWNSILESLWFGVPIATLPLHAEQHLNAFEMVKELGLAVEIKLDYCSGFYCENDRTVLGAQEIEKGLMRLMEHDSDVRKRVKEMGEKSRKAVMEGGSSYSSLGYLINDLFENF